MSNEFLSSKLSKLPNLKTLQSKFSELKNFNARLTEMITLFPKSFVGLPIDCLKKEWIKSFKKGLITKEFGQIKILRQSIVDLAILTGKGQRTIERGMTMFFKRSYNFDNINPYSKEWFIFGTSDQKQNTKRKKKIFNLKPKISLSKQKRDKVKLKQPSTKTKQRQRQKLKQRQRQRKKQKQKQKQRAKEKKSHKLSSNQKLRSIPKSKHNHKLKLNNQVLQTIKTQPELMFAKTEQTNLTQSIFNNESGEQQLNNAKISLNTPLSSTTEREREGETETETETQRQTKTTDSEQVIRKRRYESKTTETDHLKKRKFLAENDPFDFQDEETPFDHLHETPLNNVLEKIFEENGISYVELDTNGSSHSLIIENEQESHLITEFTNFVPVEQNWYVDLDTSFFDQIDEFVNLDDEESQNFVCESWFI